MNPPKIHSHKLIGALDNKPLKVPKKRVPIVPPDLPSLHSLMGFIGQIGSGKTHTLVRLVRAYQNARSINRVYIICPSYESNEDVYKLLNPDPQDVYTSMDAITSLKDVLRKAVLAAEQYKEYEVYYKLYQKYARGTPLTIHEKTMLENNHYVKPPLIPFPSPVLILDDLSHTNIYQHTNDNPFTNLCLRQRHFQKLGLSIFMAVQTFTNGIPKSIRQNVRQYFFWKTKDGTQIEQIWKEVANLATKEEFFHLFYFATKKKNDFLLIDHNPQHHLLTFRKNFDTVLNIEDFAENQLDHKNMK